MILLFAGFTIAPLLQSDEEQPVVAGPHKAEQAEARDGSRVFHPRHFRQDVFDFSARRVRAFEGSCVGKLEMHEKIALIFVGQKARWDPVAEETGRESEAHEQDQGHRALVNESPRKTDIAIRGALEDAVEPIEETAEQPVALLFRPEHQCRKGRTESERVECRKNHRDRDRDRELLIEPPGNSRYERRRHEHRRENQRNAYHRPGDFFHRFQSCCFGRQTFFDVALHRLDHHDGVVYHQADRQHQAEQRERVDRESEHGKEDECTDQ